MPKREVIDTVTGNLYKINFRLSLIIYLYLNGYFVAFNFKEHEDKLKEEFGKRIGTSLWDNGRYLFFVIRCRRCHNIFFTHARNCNQKHQECPWCGESEKKLSNHTAEASRTVLRSILR